MSMAALIQRVGRLALQVFCREHNNATYMNAASLSQLKSLVSTITSADLAISIPDLVESNNASENNAPVLYLQLFENNDINVCVFIVKEGFRLPMHDHPGMHGLLKVFHGTIKVHSFSIKQEPSSGHEFYLAARHNTTLASVNERPLHVKPDAQNLHEIQAVGGPAAFLDILSPPYGFDKRLNYQRECNYYKPVSTKEDTVMYIENVTESEVLLKRIPAPSDFWCSEIKYTGPPLHGVIDDGKSWRRFVRRKRSSVKK